MLRKVIALLGLATIVFVIANVHFGVVADNVVEGAGTARLDVLRLADPGCTIPEMEKEIQEKMSTYHRRPGYPLDYPGTEHPIQPTSYFSNRRLKKIRERKY